MVWGSGSKRRQPNYWMRWESTQGSVEVWFEPNGTVLTAAFTAFQSSAPAPNLLDLIRSVLPW
jgi:hypothetical protein